MITRLINPYGRKSIITHFKQLFDKEFQKRWYDSDYKHAFWDSLLYYVFDYLGNMDFEMDPEENIEVCTYNLEEAIEIGKVINFFYDEFEGEMPDDYYVNHPKWPELLAKTKKLLEMLEENNEKFNFKKNLQDFDEADDRLDPDSYIKWAESVMESNEKNSE